MGSDVEERVVVVDVERACVRDRDSSGPDGRRVLTLPSWTSEC
jgi:hypothetical protein